MASTPAELRERIKGVVVGLVTLFNDDYSINHEGMRTHVEYLIENGINVLMISRGVSELPYLSYDEIKAVTKTIVEAAAGRVPVITSTFEWWTGQAIEFARFAQDVGADGCIIVLPSYYANYNPALHDDAICEHFEAIAHAADIGLVIHERNLVGWGGMGIPFPVSLVDRLADIDHVVALKLEGGDRFYAQSLIRKTRDRLVVIGDWGPEAWFFAHEYGMQANIAGMGQYTPKLEVQVWNDMQEGRLAEARETINEVMTPFWTVWKGMDWVAAMKASMEFVGLPASPMRPPNAQLTMEQREQLRQAMHELGLLP